MMLRMVVALIEKGFIKDRINPREEPRMMKKRLKENVIKSVIAI